jgi:pyruvate,water dikinase
MSDLSRVGGKNASPGELFAALKLKGVGILDRFAVTTNAWRLLEEKGLYGKLEHIFAGLDSCASTHRCNAFGAANFVTTVRLE